MSPPAASPRVASPPPVVAVMGLGYVGLPLVLAFGQHLRTLGFDIDAHKVRCCQQGLDPSREWAPAEMARAHLAQYTHDAQQLAQADVIIVAVPTPVDAARTPDFGPLKSACACLGPHLKRGALVVFESTVYPGATEEVCIPCIEAHSGLRWPEDFQVGYSPERINPGDREHGLTQVLKVVAGDSAETLERVAALYERVVTAGVYRCSSIRVAEAAKVIENTQRDVNIALVNELALIFHRLGIDTHEVLAAAGTKWNFLKFTPGLVGGHCIGVDPYYLTHKAETVGYHPQVILSGRRINDGMGAYIAQQTVKQLIAAGSAIKGAQVNVLGLTFKENCADLRNTKVLDIVRELQSYGVRLSVHDPWADPQEAQQLLGQPLTRWEDLPRAQAVVAAVAHTAYTELNGPEVQAIALPAAVVVDVKAIWDAAALRAAGLRVWRL